MTSVAFLLGTGITMALWKAERKEVEQRSQARFNFRVDEVKAAIAGRMNACEQVLRGGVSLFSTLGNASRSQWHTYVSSLDLTRNMPGIHGVGYAEYVRNADKTAFVRRLHGQGLPDYAIRPPGDRPEYAPVTYLEPNTERNLRAHGFDMMSEPARRAAMLEARDSGRAAITGKLKLASEAQQSPVSGFLMYLPVYRTGMPIDTLEQRQAAIQGFVNSPFRFNDLLRGALDESTGYINLKVFDGEQITPDALMYDDGAMDVLPANQRSAFEAHTQLNIQGHTWTLQFNSLPGFDRAESSEQPRTLLFAGLGISMLLASLVWLTAARLAQTRHEHARFEHLARFDHLTGRPNRAQFNQRLSEVLTQSQRDNRRAALVFVDLDNFKFINDSQGHDAGDALLKVVAQRLCDSARDSDVVSRLGGDEFTVLLSGINNHSEVAAVADRIVAALSQPFEWNHRRQMVTASLGIALYPDDGADAITLLKNADSAMYRAKALGKCQFQFYTEEMNTAATRRLAVQEVLRQALQDKQFRLAYQPIVDFATGRLTGLEALLRLPQEGPDPIPTAELIATAEQCGLIGAIGDIVMADACRQMALWPLARSHGIKLAINMSARQFHEKNLVQRLRHAVALAGIDASQLELELTETAFLDDRAAALDIMQALCASGISIALDDFGTGYSSLSYLNQFPISKIKIDRSFVKDLGGPRNDGAIVRAIVAMGASLRVTVVAEGIETDDQLNHLRTLGCHQGQGHYFCPAATPEELQQRYGSQLGTTATAEHPPAA